MEGVATLGTFGPAACHHPLIKALADPARAFAFVNFHQRISMESGCRGVSIARVTTFANKRGQDRFDSFPDRLR